MSSEIKLMKTILKSVKRGGICFLLLASILSFGGVHAFNIIARPNSYAIHDEFKGLDTTRLDAHIPRNTEDFTGFNETDGPGKVTVAANTITLTDGDRDEDYYVTKDFGAGYFGDFTHWVDVNVTAITADGNSSFYFDAMSNANDDLFDIDAANGDCIFLGVGRIGAGYRVGIYNVDGGALTISTGGTTNTLGNPVYISSSRVGTALTAEVYSTAALRIAGGAGDVDTITHTVVATAFQFVYGLASYNNAGTAKDISGTVSNLWLGTSGNPELATPWISATGTIQGNEAVMTETLGGELVTDGAFATTQLAAAKVITGITSADPGIVTLAAGHGYVDGQVIFIEALDEMTELNDEYWKIRNLAGNTAELSNAAIGTWDSSSLDTSGFGFAEITGGTAKAVSFADWIENTGWHPGVDGAGSLTGTADCDGEQGSPSALLQITVFIASKYFNNIYTLSNYTGGAVRLKSSDNSILGSYQSSDATYTTYGLNATANTLSIEANSTFIGSIDDVSVKQVTLSSILALSDFGYSSGRFKATFGTVASGELAGLVILANDSTASTDGVFGTIGQTANKLHVRKRVAGTDTTLINEAVTYNDGDTLWLVFDRAEQKLWAFFDNAIVGTAQALTDASIIDNSFHGILLTGGATITSVDFKELGYNAALTTSGDDITKANPGVVTVTGHPLSNGDLVYFSGLTQMTEMNQQYDIVANDAANTFSIRDTSGFGSAETTGGAVVQKVR